MILRQCDDFATAGAQNAPRHQRSRLSGDAKFSNFEKVDLINFFVRDAPTTAWVLPLQGARCHPVRPFGVAQPKPKGVLQTGHCETI
jgi:hypothetical protein